MTHLDWTAATPAENLAADEALLDWCESGRGEPVLRLWEPTEYFVVIGYGEEVNREVNLPACLKANVPIFRRCSGGGTVLQGPGCLNYALVLNMGRSPALQSINQTNTLVMSRHARALATIAGRPIRVAGYTDLVCDNRKFSGNSQRRRKEWLLFHGTFLLDFDTARMEELLRSPSRQPAYRAERTHSQFVTSLKLAPQMVKVALRAAWECRDTIVDFPAVQARKLAEKKYLTPEWNFRR